MTLPVACDLDTDETTVVHPGAPRPPWDRLFVFLDTAVDFGASIQLRSGAYAGDLEGDVRRWVDAHRAKLGLVVEETTDVLDHGRRRVVRVLRKGAAVVAVLDPLVMTSAKGARV